jgi:hypothetical protein
MAVVTTLMASPIFDRLVGDGSPDSEKETEDDDAAVTHLTP